MRLEIHSLEEPGEQFACEELMQKTWVGDPHVPQHVLVTALHAGGQLIGAFDLDAPGQPLVGFVFSFIGLTEDQTVKHCSHMAAVLPAYRNAKIGEKLKLAQRERVLAQGIKLITWTYDPLISRNAYLNIHKLGTTTSTYLQNVYGPDPLAEHTSPSDRFQVDWWIDTEHVRERIANAHVPRTAADLLSKGPLLNPHLDGPTEPLGAPSVLLQIPADIRALAERSNAEAIAWRYQQRTLAEAAFAAGYQVVDFIRDGERGLYLLEKH